MRSVLAEMAVKAFLLLFFQRNQKKEGILEKIMTEKARQIMNKMREKDRMKRVLARFKDPKHRSETMDSINRMDQDEPARVGGGDQEIKVLSEMNQMEDEHEQYMENMLAERL